MLRAKRALAVAQIRDEEALGVDPCTAGPPPALLQRHPFGAHDARHQETVDLLTEVLGPPFVG
jgi:hypothetical protein